jgi:UrcA family protein
VLFCVHRGAARGHRGSTPRPGKPNRCNEVHVMSRKTIGALAAVVLAGSGLGAAAQAGDETMRVTGESRHAHELPRAAPRSGTEIRSVVVNYGDLDVVDEEGAATLYRRLQVASRQVCSPREDAHNLTQAAHWKVCYSGALDDAVAKVGDLRVTALHRAKTGRDAGREPQLAGTR